MDELKGLCPTCSECDGSGVSNLTAITPMPCMTCARRAMGIEPYSIWYVKGGSAEEQR